MNRLDTRHAAEVMLHEADGGKVERLDLNNIQSGWLEHVVGHWDWTSFDYRVAKPEPKTIWINEYSGTNLCAHTTREAAVFNCAPITVQRQAVEYKEVTDE